MDIDFSKIAYSEAALCEAPIIAYDMGWQSDLVAKIYLEFYVRPALF